MKYQVRRVSPADAEAEVLDLWQRRPSGTSSALFRWGYLTAPAAPTECFLLDGVDGTSSHVVGMVGVGSRRFDIGGKSVSAGLLGDFFIDKAHRTFFPALTLQRASVAWARAKFDFVYGFPNGSAAPIMKRLGFRDVARLERHVLVLRHAPYIAPRVRSKALARALAAPIDGVRRLIHPGISRGPRDRLTFGRLRATDARFDRLFEAHAFAECSIGRRDADLVRWRLLERPDEDTSIYALAKEEDGPLQAYAAVHIAGDVAHVRDLLGVDIDAMTEILRLVAGAARRRHCVALSFACTAPPRFLERLLAIGFRLRPGHRTMIGCAGNGATDRDPTALERWYLTEADEDQ